LLGLGKCPSCGTYSPESDYCPSCGMAKRKWCPRCGEWQTGFFETVEVDDSSEPAIAIAHYHDESRFCPKCGSTLQTKPAPHE
jgi:ribosomal protein L32